MHAVVLPFGCQGVFSGGVHGRAPSLIDSLGKHKSDVVLGCRGHSCSVFISPLSLPVKLAESSLPPLPAPFASPSAWPPLPFSTLPRPLQTNHVEINQRLNLDFNLRGRKMDLRSMRCISSNYCNRLEVRGVPCGITWRSEKQGRATRPASHAFVAGALEASNGYSCQNQDSARRHQPGIERCPPCG